MSMQRRLAIGAELQGDSAHFRVWAPAHREVCVVVETGRAAGEYPLEDERAGYHAGAVRGVAAGDRYRFRLGGESCFSDPASRYQPEGPFGPSQLVDPSTFEWTDQAWEGVSLPGQILYEMHIGTFTREGTWAAAARELKSLADLGITVIEVMPPAEFPGKFGWGYDGVFLFAPTRLYGSPDDFRRFVDTAHSVGLGVILDVVYNHFGPDGNVMAEYTPEYFSERHKTEWGKPLNFDGKESGPVREFFLDNASYWVNEFHIDGIRLDATQAIEDESSENILKLIAERVRAAANGRATIVIHENESQDANMIRPLERGGLGLDGAWNDDFHHSAMVALSGRNEAYYTDHLGRPQEFVSSAKYGYLLQGERYSWQENRRGTPAFDLEPWRFVTFLDNHDQVANSGKGSRCHQKTSPGRYRAMTALLLLGPNTPLLFQGQEFAASTPFFYFADHKPDLAKEVKFGRAEFLTQFRRLDHAGLVDEIPDPADPATFEMSKLDLSEREKHGKIYRMHKDLIALRKSDPAFRQQRRGGVDGAVLGERAFILRYFAGDAADRLLVVNFGCDLHLDQAPEPLLAPPGGHGWDILWSSEATEYGGEGTPPVETIDGWRLMGEATIVLKPVRRPVPKSLPSRDNHKTTFGKLIAERKRRERTKMGE
jgi:maltooligosyltrehalose trehalohydrolase